MQIPFEPVIFNTKINIHLVLEYLAFFAAFQYYLVLRKNSNDSINTHNRLSIILAASIGALVGSRLVGFVENPLIAFTSQNIIQLLNVKTIMGGLFGGLLAVELVKWKIGEKQSSGDLFTLPIIVGIFIGRVGCFLAGTNEFTYGKATGFFMGMNLGDGLQRHPLALYELVFLTGLYFIFKHIQKQNTWESGMLFKCFMLCYFGFRFFLEFLKPNVFYLLGLSSIQWLCIACFIYYNKTLYKFFTHAY